MVELTDIPFEKGLYIKVPKGTELIDRYTYYYGREKDPEFTKREVIVEISGVDLPSSEHMLTEDEKKERAVRLQAVKDACEAKRISLSVDVHYPAVTTPNIRGGGSHTTQAYTRKEIPKDNTEWPEVWRKSHDEENAIQEEYQRLGASRFDADHVMVFWSKNNNVTWAKNVQLVEKPEARKKQPKVNLRQQMVPNSRWKFTQDVDIYYGAPNGVFHAHVNAWDKANPRPEHNHRDGSYQKWYTDREAMRKNAQDTLGEYTPKLYRNIKAGEIITINGKFNTYWNPYGWNGQRYTNAAPAVFDGDDKTSYLEYSMIKDFIEAESIPTVDVWCLRYKPTGKFYLSSDYPRTNNTVDGQEMVDTFMKGKKWDNLGKAKTSILMMTGYYENLPGADEALPEWGGGGKTLELNDDWELVKFDKLGRKELGPVEDFQEWFKRSWELRALTVKYGSSVRTAYKALEKANMLDTQKGMIVFTEHDQEKLDNVSYYDEKTAISKEEQDFIDAAIKSTQMKKGAYKKATDFRSVAVTFPNKGAAMMFKLAYNGKLKTTILDLETLTEAVDG